MSVVQPSEKALPGRAPAVYGSRRNTGWPYKAFSYLCLTLVAVTMVVPFMWMISTSFKDATEIRRPNFFPENPVFENYEEVILDTELPRW